MDLLAVFDNLDDAIALTPKVMNAGITPVCVEFMDNASIKQVEIFLDENCLIPTMVTISSSRLLVTAKTYWMISVKNRRIG